MSATSEPRLSFNGLLLVSVVVLMFVGIVLGAALYILPREHPQLPELQPAARVARIKDFPIGASRIVNWGDDIILVIRRGPTEYYGLQATAPSDGCILEWDAESGRVVSPCSHLVYDLRGNVVVGLTTAPIRQFAVFERSGVVYVTG